MKSNIEVVLISQEKEREIERGGGEEVESSGEVAIGNISMNERVN